jgi:RNA polymerase sigma-70 factor (ECF subfamily)
VALSAAAAATREADLALVQRAADGDIAAQRAVFVAQRDGVHRTLFRIFGSNQEIEDLCQDAFVEIVRSLPAFRGESSLARWCQTIATRVAYAAIARRRPPPIDLSLVEDELPAADDVARTAQIRRAGRRLYAALEHLEPKQRIAFALAVIDERSLAEVAVLTESTRVAVKTRVWRARRALQRRAAADPVLRQYLADIQEEAP